MIVKQTYFIQKAVVATTFYDIFLVVSTIIINFAIINEYR